MRSYRNGFMTVLGELDLFGLSEQARFHLVHNEVFNMLEKGAVKRVGGQSCGAVTGGVFSGLHPMLFEHLSLDVWSDGSPRRTSSLTVFVSEGQFKAVLKDKEESLCLWMASLSFDDVLLGLELALMDPATVWRLDRQDNAGSSKRVQKGR